MEETTEGKLKHLEHIWEKGIFKMSVVHIEVSTRETNHSSAQEFYGQIPESILGKNVHLYQQRKGTEVVQKLTVKDEENEDKIYQIKVNHIF